MTDRPTGRVVMGTLHIYKVLRGAMEELSERAHVMDEHKVICKESFLPKMALFFVLILANLLAYCSFFHFSTQPLVVEVSCHVQTKLRTLQFHRIN